MYQRKASKPRSERKPRARVCRGCAARKIKCVRAPGATSCDACAIHGIACSGVASTAAGRAASPEGRLIDKPDFRPRVGSTIGKLQRLAAAKLTDHDLSRDSAMSRLVFEELGGALTWALVNSAFEDTSVQSLSPLNSLNVVRDDFRKSGMRTLGLGRDQEVLLACYTAIGSRRTDHSAIVGGCSRKHPPRMGVGARREAACRALVDRAVALLEATTILTDGTVKNVEIMTAVKEMIMGKSLPPFATPSAHPLHPVVHPNHPFSRQISPILHNLRLQLFQNGRQFTFSEEVATGFALYDARICARDGVRTHLSQQDISFYVFGGDSIPDALVRLAQPQAQLPSGLHLTGWILTTQFALLSKLYDLREEARHAPLKAQSTLSYLQGMVDIATSYVKTKLATAPRTPSPPHSPSTSPSPLDRILRPASRYDILGEVPDVFLSEVHLANISFRICREDGVRDGPWADVERVASIRFLKGLKWLVEVLSDSRFSRTADVHWVARRLENLEIVPEWVALTLEGASQVQEGPLAEADFRYGDLRLLYDLFENASVVFASSAMRAEELRLGLDAVGQLEVRFEAVEPVNPADCGDPAEVDLAALMVDAATSDLLDGLDVD